MGAYPEEGDLEGLGKLTFHEIKGERDLGEGAATDVSHLLLVKLWKHNIGTEEKPKIESIGDYLDEHTTKKILIFCRNIRTCSKLWLQS